MCSWNSFLAKSSTIRAISGSGGGGGCTTIIFKSWLSSNTASISRINRNQYLRTYPTLLVNPDGSTLTVRYHEPRKIIKLVNSSFFSLMGTRVQIVSVPEPCQSFLPFRKLQLKLKLPLDLSKFSEEERKILLEKRKSKTKITVEDDVDEISFDTQKYLKLVKK